MSWPQTIGLLFLSIGFVIQSYHLVWTNKRITKLQSEVWELQAKEAHRKYLEDHARLRAETIEKRTMWDIEQIFEGQQGGTDTTDT